MSEDELICVPAEALVAFLLDRRCNVCVGISPPWDGHDKNPMCVGAAREHAARALDPTLLDEPEATA